MFILNWSVSSEIQSFWGDLKDENSQVIEPPRHSILEVMIRYNGDPLEDSQLKGRGALVGNFKNNP